MRGRSTRSWWRAWGRPSYQAWCPAPPCASAPARTPSAAPRHAPPPSCLHVACAHTRPHHALAPARSMALEQAAAELHRLCLTGLCAAGGGVPVQERRHVRPGVPHLPQRQQRRRPRRLCRCALRRSLPNCSACPRHSERHAFQQHPDCQTMHRWALHRAPGRALHFEWTCIC